MAATGVMTATQAEPRSAPDVRRRRFARTNYHAMGKAGILGHQERLELTDGEIFVRSPIGRRHAACVDWINAAFFESGGLAGRPLARAQNPMADSEHSEPQPDLMLPAERADRYADSHEAADSTLTFDRRTTMPLYAADGIREAWLVDQLGVRICPCRPYLAVVRTGHTSGDGARRAAS